MKDQTVTITGVAYNGKAGAIVKTKDGDVYYIDRLSSWIPDFENKEISVTGNLMVVIIPEEDLKNERGEWKQGVEGKVKMLQNAKWEILPR